MGSLSLSLENIFSSGIEKILQFFMNLSTLAMVLMLLAIPLSQELLTRELDAVGVPLKKEWFIKPGEHCNVAKEKKASAEFLLLKNTSKSEVVKGIVGNICFGGEEPKEPDINPIRCTHGICDCWHEAYTWDVEAKTCRTGLDQPCHTSGGLKCVTHTTCTSQHRCNCDPNKECSSKKVKALASITIPVNQLCFVLYLFISIF